MQHHRFIKLYNSSYSVLPFKVYITHLKWLKSSFVCIINRYFDEMLTIQQDIGYQISSSCTFLEDVYTKA